MPGTLSYLLNPLPHSPLRWIEAKARAEGRFPGRRPLLTEQQREYIREERSRGVSQRELAKRLEVSRWTIQQVDG